MSPHHASRALLSLRGEDGEPAINDPSAHEYAMLEELSFIRREAQAEANLAYEDWRGRQCRDTYAVYLAAQDRADAAQDQLAYYVRRVAA
jgi:hypothetical protein